MKPLRGGAVVGLVVAVAACTASPSPTTSVVAWADRVPTPAPEAIAAQPVIDRTSDSYTLLPISPLGASVGVSYLYQMPHCGIRTPIDVDGSFWDATGIEVASSAFDGVAGRFRLDSRDVATFTDESGAVLHLARHTGAKTFFGFCA